MNNKLIMENWRRYLKEFVPDPSTNFDIAPLAAKGLSNKQRVAYSKKLIDIYHPGKSAITPEVIQKVKAAVKNAWDNFGYNQFAALWNNTLGFVLPELPRTDQGDTSFGLDIAFLIFEIVGYVFGYAFLIKGYKVLKKVLTPIFKVVAKIPGVEKLKNISAEKVSQVYEIIKDKFASAAQKIKSGGPKLVDSINSNFERGMLNLLGAV